MIEVIELTLGNSTDVYLMSIGTGNLWKQETKTQLIFLKPISSKHFQYGTKLLASNIFTIMTDFSIVKMN